MQRFRGGLVFKAHRLCVSLDTRLDSNKEEEEDRERALTVRSHTTFSNGCARLAVRELFFFIFFFITLKPRVE